MKKIISMSLVCVLLISCVLTLAACGKTLSGKYSMSVAGIETSYEFSGKNVTITYPKLMGTGTLEGTYEISETEEGKTIITFTFEGDEAEDYKGEYSFAEGEEDGTKYIKIGGVKYTKAK